MLRVSSGADRAARIEQPLIFVEGAAYPLRRLSNWAHDQALYLDQAKAGFIQDIDIHLELGRIEGDDAGVGESIDWRRGVEMDPLDLHGHKGFAFHALPVGPGR